MNSKQEFIIVIIFFILSIVILNLGISFCIKFDRCERPIINGQCSDATESCQYHNFIDIVSGSCGLNTATNSRCFYCRYVNNIGYEATCVSFFAVGGTGVICTSFYILIYLWKYYTSRHENNEVERQHISKTD